MSHRSVIIFSWIFTATLFGPSAACQNLAPFDVSQFRSDRQIRARVADVHISECKGAAESKEYREYIAGTMSFQNRSSRPVLLYKNLNPWATERIAVSLRDTTMHKYVAGYNADRVALTEKPKRVSIDDFQLIKPGGTYARKIHATLFASAGNKSHSLHSGEYWIQLGIDARPDEFYFDSGAKAEFKRNRARGAHIAEFILADPFPLELRLDPKAPMCDAQR